MDFRIPVHRPFVGQKELRAIERVFESRWLGMGAVTKEFEQGLRGLLGAKHVFAVNTGTAALHVALAALGLQAGDEVIVPSLTFVSTIQAILACGARPVFCEVHPETLNIDVEDAARRVGRRTKAILPVHYGGAVCEFDSLQALAQQRRLWIVEDAAHAFGSSYNGRPVGVLGDLTCFSFDPIKTITCGQGGAVVTNHDQLAVRIRSWRNVGTASNSWDRSGRERLGFYQVATPGFRYGMSDLNAAIGLEQLKSLDEFRSRRRAIARRYDEALRGLAGLALLSRDLEQSCPFSYALRVLNGQRDALMEHLAGRQIGTLVQFVPNHLQPAFNEFRVSLPVTERLFEEILSLPLYFEMTAADVDEVIDGVRAFRQQETSRMKSIARA